MAAYMKKAEQASTIIDGIMDQIKNNPTPDQGQILSQLIYLYNLGIRTAPRPTQSTVRLNAVSRAARNQPASIRLVEKSGKGFDGRTYTYKAINIQVSIPNTSVSTVEDGDNDAE